MSPNVPATTRRVSKAVEQREVALSSWATIPASRLQQTLGGAARAELRAACCRYRSHDSPTGPFRERRWEFRTTVIFILTTVYV